MPITLFGQATILLKPSRDDGDIGNVVVELRKRRPRPSPDPSRLSPIPSLFREGGIYTINFSFLPSLNREGSGEGLEGLVGLVGLRYFAPHFSSYFSLS